MQFNLTVTPAVSYIRIKPGSIVNHTVTLENNSLEPLTVTPSVVDFSSDGKTGVPVLSTTTAFPYLDLESIHSQTVTIPPLKRAQLTLRFEVPENAEEKEYPLTLLFKSALLPAPSSESSSNLVGAIGSNIIVLISQEEQVTNKLELVENGVPSFLNSTDTLTIVPLVKNNSFAATTVAGTVTIKNPWGAELTTFHLFPDTVLGYSSREMRAMRTVFQPDIEPEAVPIAYKNSPALFGPHTVTITLTQPYTSQNSNQVVSTYTSNFFALPYMTTAILFFALFLGVFFVFFKKKNADK